LLVAALSLDGGRNGPDGRDCGIGVAVALFGVEGVCCEGEGDRAGPELLPFTLLGGVASKGCPGAKGWLGCLGPCLLSLSTLKVSRQISQSEVYQDSHGSAPCSWHCELRRVGKRVVEKKMLAVPLPCVIQLTSITCSILTDIDGGGEQGGIGQVWCAAGRVSDGWNYKATHARQASIAQHRTWAGGRIRGPRSYAESVQGL
jgi:hypothetical protein